VEMNEMNSRPATSARPRVGGAQRIQQRSLV
jgi:hypothetical protein